MSGPEAPESIIAVSEAEYRAETSGEGLPPAARIRSWLLVLPQSLPSRHSPRYTLSYLIVDADGGIHVIDPGWDSPENRRRLLDLLAELDAGLDRVVSSVSTHLHRDHLGLADWLRDESGARVVLHAAEQRSIDLLAEAERTRTDTDRRASLIAWGVPQAFLDALEGMSVEATASASQADALVQHGDLLAIPGRSLEVIHTPGHTPGHIAVVDRGGRLVFTGDHLLPSIFGGIGLGGPADDPVGDHLASLDALEQLGSAPAGDPAAYEVLPGHGFRFTGLGERIRVTRAHHLRRSAEVAAVLDADPEATVWQVAERIRWPAGWSALRPFHRFSALAQTAMHIDHLRVTHPTARP
ncbi:MBL fold metallo-hydrolase [Herbiconiux liangxiaofengii]|uniref:MBL fold metallo-hydrolase n=1 Tax=Herbiconiux liangxiaofengii TaxID=3342795 RepID=UPI0035BB0020